MNLKEQHTALTDLLLVYKSTQLQLLSQQEYYLQT